VSADLGEQVPAAPRFIDVDHGANERPIDAVETRPRYPARQHDTHPPRADGFADDGKDD
jgi:hypothetical protein